MVSLRLRPSTYRNGKLFAKYKKTTFTAVIEYIVPRLRAKVATKEALDSVINDAVNWQPEAKA